MANRMPGTAAGKSHTWKAASGGTSLRKVDVHEATGRVQRPLCWGTSVHGVSVLQPRHKCVPATEVRLNGTCCCSSCLRTQQGSECLLVPTVNSRPASARYVPESRLDSGPRHPHLLSYHCPCSAPPHVSRTRVLLHAALALEPHVADDAVAVVPWGAALGRIAVDLRGRQSDTRTVSGYRYSKSAECEHARRQLG